MGLRGNQWWVKTREDSFLLIPLVGFFVILFLSFSFLFVLIIELIILQVQFAVTYRCISAVKYECKYLYIISTSCACSSLQIVQFKVDEYN